MNIVVDFLRGFKDSLTGIWVIRELDKNAKHVEEEIVQTPQPVLSTLAKRRANQAKLNTENNENSIVITKKRETTFERLVQCCGLNGVLCVIGFLIADKALLPCFKMLFVSVIVPDAMQFWLDVFWWVANSLYFIPMLIFTKTINLMWFQDIAEASYRRVRGRPQGMSFGKMIADFAFTFFLESLFAIQANLVHYLITIYIMNHYLASIAYSFHMMLLYSLYTFEYRWYLMGWPTHKRLIYIELHWPYFLGFGLPLYIVSNIGNSYILNTSIFALVFPIFIVSANEARTVPLTFFSMWIFTPVSRLTNFIFKKIMNHGSLFYPMIASISAIILGMIVSCFVYCLYPISYLVHYLTIYSHFFKNHKTLTTIFVLLLFVVFICLVIFKNISYFTDEFNNFTV